MSQPRIITAPTVTRLPADAAGQVLVTGSHGGLYAGMLAAKAGVRAVIFHDAGIGMAGASVSHMSARVAVPPEIAETRVVETVAAGTARIGEARSTFEDGMISAANPTAIRLGAVIGGAAKPLLLAWTRMETTA